MKKLILGLDGMDFDIAVDLNLSNILQIQFERIQVPISRILGVPSSPEVWASFLCAEWVEMRFKGRKRHGILKYLVKLKRALPFLSFGLGAKVSGKAGGFPDLDRKTWVDLPNVKEFNVPYYSYKNEVFDYTQQFSEDKDLDAYQKKILDLYERDTRNLMVELKSEVTHPECDVFFAYLHFPDMFNHLWLKELDALYAYYRQMDGYVGQVLDLVKDTHVIIVSDHGFDLSKGDHSDFGFVSSNRFMNFPRDIMGLGALMYAYAGVPKGER